MFKNYQTKDYEKTSLGDGSRVYKDEPLIETIGIIDELTCILGLINLPEITNLQKELMSINAILSRFPNIKFDLSTATARLEKLCDDRNRLLPPLKSFILPKSFIHLARSIARRCERRLVGLYRQGIIDNKILILYFDRLSDYLFVIARTSTDQTYP